MIFEIFHINRTYQERFETLHSHHIEIQQNKFTHKNGIVSGIYRTVPGCNIEIIKTRLQFDSENAPECIGYKILSSYGG